MTATLTPDISSASTSAPSPTTTSARAFYTNPVYEGDFPDPFVLRVGEVFYAYATNVRSNNIPVLRSTDLATWERLGDALPKLPKWALPSAGLTWAPAVLERGGRYVMYYTARHAASGLQCISMAVSDAPNGPFIDKSSEPFICQRDIGGSIDPSPYVEDGQAYLLWKNDGNCCGYRVGLWIQPLSDDGLTLKGEPLELVHYDQDWERPLVEAPALLKHDGTYYLFYSANGYESENYAVGYAESKTLFGPYTKPLNKPIFATTADVKGPGGQEFFTDGNGQLWMAYHAWSRGAIGYRFGGVRSLRIDRVSFVDGVPVISGPTTNEQPLT